MRGQNCRPLKCLISLIASSLGRARRYGRSVLIASKESATEIIRVLKNAPKWEPALRGGKPFSVAIKFPLTFKEKETQVKLDSEPQGAEVYMNQHRIFSRAKLVRVGRTPTTFSVDNKHDAEFVFKKDGYEEATFTDKSEIANGWMFASFVCLIMPAIIDLASKNAKNLETSDIKVKLDPVLPKQAEQVNTKK